MRDTDCGLLPDGRSLADAVTHLVTGGVAPERTADEARSLAAAARARGREGLARVAEVHALDVRARSEGPAGVVAAAQEHLGWAVAAGDTRLACHCHALLAMTDVMLGHPGTGAEHATTAVALLDGTESPRLVVRLLTRQAVGLFAAGLVDPGLDVTRRAVRLAEELEDPDLVTQLAANAVQGAIDSDRTTEADRWTAVLLDAVDGRPRLRDEVSDVIARGHLSAGRPEKALDELVRADERGRPALEADSEAVRLLLLAQASRGVGRLEDARSFLAQASALAEAADLAEVMTALLEEEAALAAAVGDFALAYRHLRRFHAETHARWIEASTARVGELFAEQSLADALRRAAQAEEASNTDALTGVRSRRWVQEELPRIVRSQARADRRVGLAIVDLDHFKLVNDQRGHDVGDDVLRAVGRELGRSAGVSDVARLGGEEFLLVLLEPVEQWRPVVEAVLARIRDLRWEGGCADLVVTASIGLGEVGCGSSVSEGLRQADRRLYRAKTAGRDRTVGPWSYPAADG